MTRKESQAKTMRLLFAVIPLAAVLLILSGVPMFANTAELESDTACHTLPAEITDFASGLEFEPVRDFYHTHPGPVDPPYVYGYDCTKSKWLTVAFWCRETSDSLSDDRAYLLVFARRNWEGSTFEVERSVESGWIGGLSVVSCDADTLSGLSILGDTTGSDVRLTGQACGVRIEYDGNSELFLKKNGEWYYRGAFDW